MSVLKSTKIIKETIRRTGDIRKYNLFKFEI